LSVEFGQGKNRDVIGLFSKHRSFEDIKSSFRSLSFKKEFWWPTSKIFGGQPQKCWGMKE
jgi:hypothetical protein